MALAGSTRRSVRGGERRWGALRVPLSQGPFLGAGARAVVGMQATLSDVVVAPFVWSDGTCDFCHEGLHTFCRHGGLWARDGIDGGQGEAVRVPQAQGTLVQLPVGEDDALLPSLLTLSDVF